MAEPAHPSDFKVLGLCGSLRRASFNMAALRAAQELAPEGMKVEIGDLSLLPLFNDDVRLAGYPPEVAALRESVRRADALLFACPEYNYSIPGVLKNAIDWISRPPDQPFAAKAAAVLGVSSGLGGTVRAQHHLRQIAVFVDLRFLNRPEVMIRSAAEHFDGEGRLIDDATRQRVHLQLMALRDWALQLRR